MTEIIEGKLEIWPIDRLVPYEKNAKLHAKDQVKSIAQSIRKFGWRKSKAIEVDEHGVIINGHGRRLAAIELGMKEVPVSVVTGLTEDEIKAYRLADNKVAESGWDTRLLSDEIVELSMSGFEWDGIFDERDLDFAIEDNGEMDLGSLTDDLMSEMGEHQESTQDKIVEKDGSEVSMGKVFSFSKVTGEQARVMNLLEKYAEGKTGKSGADAICALFKSMYE